MRCRVPYISKRYSKAKNTYLKSHDVKKYIIHLCSNNLYGYAMLSFFQQEDANKNNSNSSKGSVLEVDLEFPIESRELDNDYSLAPDKIKIKKEMLSIYQLKIAGFIIFL